MSSLVVGDPVRIPVALIQENTEALRTEVEKDSVAYQELLNSVREHGVLQSILVREEKDQEGNVFYPLVDGLQRYTAACEAGLDTIPAQITTLDKTKVLAAQVMMNAVRIETKPAQYAQALKQILQYEPTLTSEELGRRVGKTKAWIESQLKLTNLLPEIQKLVDDGQLIVSNAITLAKLKDDKQKDYLEFAMTEATAAFGTRVTEAQKEMRSAARQGRVVDNSFKPVPKARKGGEIKAVLEEVNNGESMTLKGLLAAHGISDPYEAVKFFLLWQFQLDPQGVAAQKALYEAEQKKKAEDKEKNKLEAEKKKLEKAKEALAKAGVTAPSV